MFNNQKQLQVLVEQARGELLRIGKSLVDDGCIELWNLVNEISEIRRSSLIEEFGTAFAGFCSQIGRLAGAMSTMGKIGGAACNAAEENGGVADIKFSHFSVIMDAGTESFERTQQLCCLLEACVQEFSRLGAELQWLCEKDIQFVVCDAHVLNDHPELVQADAIRARLAASTDHLETLSNGWWLLAEEAKKKEDAYKTALAAYSPPHKIH
ncbi:hypothetical protein [Noviherbaspirillum suwonense]|uniref:Uncharacterized protein n=1 Tax=Noviherbaspirillum suwonense TaxID=1224511 RepID=A0ABY1Q5J8_9BURK|nr:hypothetical protein [Noviherbaspirillum suwonense]SMP59369.1 hypothetical protein SAMN06295970_10663 [Noviherbaspirillum suwonense]